MRDQIAERLHETRQRTFDLIAPLSDAELRRQHDPLMSPVIWDLGHIAHFEELWLLDNLEGSAELGEMPGLFNPFEHPRRERGGLQLPSLEECRTLMAGIRMRVLERLATIPLDDATPLLRDGYVYAMVLQHEQQHGETILQTLQLKQGVPYQANRMYPLPPAPAASDRARMVHFSGGRVGLGTDDRTAAYDNERPAHEADIAPFDIDVYPVTNGDFMEFIRAGGYGHESLWSPEGWRWLAEAGVDAPKYWFRDGGAWCSRSMDAVAPVRLDAPVCHVSFHEAEAFARFAMKRLPTEQEWEIAAGWNEAERRMQPFPWGDAAATPQRANIDQLSFGVAPVGSYAANWSPLGCHGMIGDVWEWTSSDFRPYPGYQTYPYKEYSELFFGTEYKVLRGGSWATRPDVARNSFRNWDYPIRRQIFSGFRCAR